MKENRLNFNSLRMGERLLMLALFMSCALGVVMLKYFDPEVFGVIGIAIAAVAVVSTVSAIGSFNVIFPSKYPLEDIHLLQKYSKRNFFLGVMAIFLSCYEVFFMNIGAFIKKATAYEGKTLLFIMTYFGLIILIRYVERNNIRRKMSNFQTLLITLIFLIFALHGVNNEVKTFLWLFIMIVFVWVIVATLSICDFVTKKPRKDCSPRLIVVESLIYFLIATIAIAVEVIVNVRL